MRQYIVKRLLFLIPTAVGVYTLIFVLIRIVPGDIVTLFLEEGGGGGSSKAAEYIRKQLNLDKPIHIQYLLSIKDIFTTGSLGRSFQDDSPVMKGIWERLPVTGELALMTVLISISIALPVGIIAAVKQDTAGDYTARVLGIISLATPNFWLATLVVVFPGIWWNYSPPVIYKYWYEDPMVNLQQMLPAALVLGTGTAGSVSRYVRSQVLEVLRQDYIRTARSKGLRERAVIIRHTLKNAMIPVVTVVGLQIAGALSGSVIAETIFNLPGLGNLTIGSINQRDYPQLQANIFFFSIIIVMMNLIVDLAYGWLDPRVRYH